LCLLVTVTVVFSKILYIENGELAKVMAPKAVVTDVWVIELSTK
jgi:hypothetical protein